MSLREFERTIAGRRVHGFVAGAGPPVVVVHGLGLSGGIFRSHCRALAAAGYRAVAPDLPGFGHSDGPALGLSVPGTATWLLALADALALDACAWLGHSLAAQATLDLVARAPDRARALILATPTGAPGRFRFGAQLLAYLRDIGREPLALVPAVARRYLRTSPLRYFGTWIRAARDHPIEKARHVVRPTLILSGERDPMVPPAFIEILRHRIPDTRFATLPGRGHGIVFRHREAFDRAVIAFLRDVVPGRAPEPGQAPETGRVPETGRGGGAAPPA